MPLVSTRFGLIVQVAALLMISVKSAAAPIPPRFKALVLPPLAGGLSCFANDMNDRGQVVGGSTTPGTGYPNAVIWVNGQVANITGNGISGASAEAINSDGVVVGMSDSLGLSAFSWKDGVLTPLMSPAQCCSGAMAVNEAGLIVGNASLGEIGTPNDGVRWDGTRVLPLGTLGGTYCHAGDINAVGQVVGVSDVRNNGEYFAFLWEDGAMVPLPTLGGTFNGANAISDNGVIVGFASPGAFGQHAVKWVNGGVIELASLGGPLSEALDVNESGWIVGSAWTSSQPSTTGALWIGGQALDLTRRTLLSPGDQIYDARGVNEGGQIVGEGIFAGAFRGYVLTPLGSGDVDGDGSVGIDDLLDVINGWGGCPAPLSVGTCPADLDSNGTVDIDDLLMVIGNWG